MNEQTEQQKEDLEELKQVLKVIAPFALVLIKAAVSMTKVKTNGEVEQACLIAMKEFDQL